jgi:hypothetical protein
MRLDVQLVPSAGGTARIAVGGLQFMPFRSHSSPVSVDLSLKQLDGSLAERMKATVKNGAIFGRE